MKRKNWIKVYYIAMCFKKGVWKGGLLLQKVSCYNKINSCHEHKEPRTQDETTLLPCVTPSQNCSQLLFHST